MISDTVKEGSKDAIRDMKQVGVKKTVMLTGDRQAAADAVAAELGIDEVHAELLPADKVGQVEKLLGAQNEKERLAFVGDGINDAPVLTRADIGIAMGSMGSDAAIEAADIVLTVSYTHLDVYKRQRMDGSCILAVRDDKIISGSDRRS